MNILITGANGQLGNALREASNGSIHHYIFTDVEELDITSAVAVDEFIKREEIEVMVNCAAYTAVDRAEDEVAVADKVNHLAVANLAKSCAEHNATLIHISTDYIFDGEATSPYSEDSRPAPLNVYGKTKLAGECAIAESGCRHIVIRTSWLYSQFGHNFCKTMRRLSATESSLRVVCDQVGTPTYAGDLAEAIVHIIESNQLSKCGTYNFSNEGVCSWYDFAVEIARLSGNTACEITPCRSEEYPTKAIRPRYSVLSKEKFSQSFSIEIAKWQESLKKCIERLKE